MARPTTFLRGLCSDIKTLHTFAMAIYDGLRNINNKIELQIKPLNNLVQYILVKDQHSDLLQGSRLLHNIY